MNESICDVCGKRFTSMTGLGIHRKLAKECSRTGPKDKSHAKRRAAEYTRQLVAEGESQHVARARARAAYGLQDRAPSGDPRPSHEMRRAWLDEAATARRSERLPSVEGRTSGPVGARR